MQLTLLKFDGLISGRFVLIGEFTWIVVDEWVSVGLEKSQVAVGAVILGRSLVGVLDAAVRISVKLKVLDLRICLRVFDVRTC